MPNTAYLGLSAHTGELSDNFDIISVDTKNLYSPAAGQGGRGPKGAPETPGSTDSLRSGSSLKQSSSGGSWTWFFFKIFAVVVVAGGAYVGYNAYRTKRKREYRGF